MNQFTLINFILMFTLNRQQQQQHQRKPYQCPGRMKNSPYYWQYNPRPPAHPVFTTRKESPHPTRSATGRQFMKSWYPIILYNLSSAPVHTTIFCRYHKTHGFTESCVIGESTANKPCDYRLNGSIHTKWLNLCDHNCRKYPANAAMYIIVTFKDSER